MVREDRFLFEAAIFSPLYLLNSRLSTTAVKSTEDSISLALTSPRSAEKFPRSFRIVYRDGLLGAGA